MNEDLLGLLPERGLRCLPGMTLSGLKFRGQSVEKHTKDRQAANISHVSTPEAPLAASTTHSHQVITQKPGRDVQELKGIHTSQVFGSSAHSSPCWCHRGWLTRCLAATRNRWDHAGEAVVLLGAASWLGHTRGTTACPEPSASPPRRQVKGVHPGHTKAKRNSALRAPVLQTKPAAGRQAVPLAVQRRV